MNLKIAMFRGIPIACLADINKDPKIISGTMTTGKKCFVASNSGKVSAIQW